MTPSVVLALSLREVRASYTTVVGWLVLCGWLFLAGVFWLFTVTSYVEATQSLVYDPYRASQLKFSTVLFPGFFGNLSIALLMFAPLLSMRAFSEDLRNRTLELLLTSPLSTFEIVAGKYLGQLWNVMVLLGATLLFPLMLAQWASPDVGALAAGYLGLLLMGSSLVSLGMLASSFTANQIVAAGITFSVSLVLFVADWNSQEDPDGFFAQIALLSHLSDLMRGEVRVSDVVYYVAFTSFCLFATNQRLESFRWK